jgi:hypothetical protein
LVQNTFLTPLKNTLSKNAGQDLGFDEFWSKYPKKVDKAAAKALYDDIVRQGRATPAQLLAGAALYEKQCTDDQTDAKYIKLPKNWLKQERWTDEPSQSQPVWRWE